MKRNDAHTSSTAERPKRAGRDPLSVSQITALVKAAITSALPTTVHVLGEISNFKRHSSGHLYFTLKDASSELSCVMWRSAADSLPFDPTDGLEVIATGRVDLFERAGRYQLYVRKLEPRGMGALELAFRQLAAKLKEEGLFDAETKKPIPPYPSRLVLITSPTGAAVADMLRTLDRRYPCADVLVYPVRVQGKGASAEIARAIRRVNANAAKLGGVDVMIVGRGGGSLEDLWAFNEEVVARAIHASRIPIISAVGHEVDVTIADLVADLRAATPTAAAELAVPVRDEEIEQLNAVASRIKRGVEGSATLLSSQLEGVLQRSVFREPLLAIRQREQWLDEWIGRCRVSLGQRLHERRRRLDALGQSVDRIDPHTGLLTSAARLHDAARQLGRAIDARLRREERHIAVLGERLSRAGPAGMLQHKKERLAGMSKAMRAAMQHRLSLARERIRREEELLGAMSYRSVLGRGFAIVRTKKGHSIIRGKDELRDRQRIETELADGTFESEVVNLFQMELFD